MKVIEYEEKRVSVSQVAAKTGTGMAFLAGVLCATGFYAATSPFLTTGPASAIPIAGSILLSAFLPTWLLKLKMRYEIAKTSLPLAQRLGVFEKHLCINVVDNNHKVSEVNDLFLETTGYSRDDVLGKPVSMLYHEQDGINLADEVRERLVKGLNWQGETPLKCSDGSIVHLHTTVIPLFDTDGNWLGSISARTDTSELRALMEQHDTFQTLNELRDDVWILDAETERFTYMNRAALKRCGWVDGTQKFKNLSHYPDPEAVAALRTACNNLKTSGEVSACVGIQLEQETFQASVKYLCDGDLGGRFLVVFHDISERLEDEQRQSDFISMVSHELRSPMTSIKGSMGLLLSNAAGELPAQALALLEIAHRNADRLVLIINDILDLEKISAGQMEFETKDVDLSELLVETNSANATLHQRFAVKVVTEGCETPKFVNTDPNRIIQVLNNFLSNACKFSQVNDTVTLSVIDMGDVFRVAVTDQGPGIPENERHKIFERFADLENSDRKAKGGTGLGLSICKAIIENLGGSIGFDTAEGQGTTFYFTLPKKQPYEVTQDNEPALLEAS